VRVLKEVDIIACEDTRQTQKLLNHYGVTTRTISYHEHNEMTRAAELVKEMQEGASVALVTDAGMPGISDPGFRLISLAIRHPAGRADSWGVGVSGGPGGERPADGFVSLQRISSVEAGGAASGSGAIKASPRTQVFYEAPHRVAEALADVVEVLGNARHVVIAREVTKLHEEFCAGGRGEVLEDVEGARWGEGRDHAADWEGRRKLTLRLGVSPPPERPPQRVEHIMAEEKVDEKAALKKVAKERGMSKSEAYRELQRSK
jgi:16S rRNA (cytidine1402-2'-O)-methyltransferase